MKKLIIIALTLAATALVAQAQTVTNIAVRIQVETGTVGGSTNTATANLRLDYGNVNDLARINGLVYAWHQYVAAGGTATLDNWIKTDVKDRATEYAKVKLSADNAALIAKLTSLLTANIDLLSVSDLNNLNSIAAKAP